MMEGSNLKRRGTLEAYFYLIVYKIFVRFISKSKLEECLGFDRNESPSDVDIDAYRKARSVRHAINAASKYVLFKKEKGIVDALVAKKMMKKRHVSISVHKGVKRGCKGEMIPHVWTRCGFYYITGISKSGNDSKRKCAASE